VKVRFFFLGVVGQEDVDRFFNLERMGLLYSEKDIAVTRAFTCMSLPFMP
jgi:hypothetical protein